MATKEYRDRLKEEDPIAYYDTFHDPLIEGCDDGLGCFVVIIPVILVLAFIGASVLLTKA